MRGSNSDLDALRRTLVDAERVRERFLLPISIGSNRSSVTESERMRSTANVRISRYSGTKATR